jgi:hypothetical protein
MTVPQKFVHWSPAIIWCVCVFYWEYLMFNCWVDSGLERLWECRWGCLFGIQIELLFRMPCYVCVNINFLCCVLGKCCFKNSFLLPFVFCSQLISKRIRFLQWLHFNFCLWANNECGILRGMIKPWPILKHSYIQHI